MHLSKACTPPLLPKKDHKKCSAKYDVDCWQLLTIYTMTNTRAIGYRLRNTPSRMLQIMTNTLDNPSIMNSWIFVPRKLIIIIMIITERLQRRYPQVNSLYMSTCKTINLWSYPQWAICSTQSISRHNALNMSTKDARRKSGRQRKWSTQMS